MNRTVFEFAHHIDFLKEKIRSLPRGGHGEKGRIAIALRCHPTYVTQVFQGQAQLSPEQGEKIARHFNLTSDEKRFFLLLLQRDRAGTSELREFHTEQLNEMLARRQILKNRLEFKKTVSKEDQAIYYSAWYFAAIHSLLSIPRFQKPNALVAHLRLGPKTVARVLEFLLKTGLAVQEGSSFKTATVHMHLGSDSAMIAKHHANWREEMDDWPL